MFVLLLLLFETGSHVSWLARNLLYKWGDFELLTLLASATSMLELTGMCCHPHFMQCQQSNQGFTCEASIVLNYILSPYYQIFVLISSFSFVLSFLSYCKYCCCKPHSSVYVSRYTNFQAVLLIDHPSSLNQSSHWLLSRDNLDRIRVSKV